MLAGYHLAIGIRRTDGIEPADPQQNLDGNITFPRAGGRRPACMQQAAMRDTQSASAISVLANKPTPAHAEIRERYARIRMH
ncbi:MAG: hypothetical protein ACRDS0_21425 [Pseudonocardiaceae bacterium]